MKLKFLVILISLLFGWVIGEVFITLLNVAPFSEITKDDSDFIISDEQVNYKYTPDLEFQISNANYTIKVKTNSDGYRDSDWETSQDTSKILVLGDSYSAGFGVEVDQRWSNVFSRHLKESADFKDYVVLNSSVSGYSLLQMINTYKILNEKHRFKWVVIGLYTAGLDRIANPFVYHQGYAIQKSQRDYFIKAGNGVYFSVFKMNFFKKGEYFLIRHLSSARILFSVLKKIQLRFQSHSATTPEGQFLTQNYLAQVENAIENLTLEMKKANQKLIVLEVCQHDKLNKFDESQNRLFLSISKRFSSDHVFFMSTKNMLESHLVANKTFWIGNDSHWNQNAHKLVGDSLYIFLNKVQKTPVMSGIRD
jgi:hypothetical protein